MQRRLESRIRKYSIPNPYCKLFKSFCTKNLLGSHKVNKFISTNLHVHTQYFNGNITVKPSATNVNSFSPLKSAAWTHTHTHASLKRIDQKTFHQAVPMTTAYPKMMYILCAKFGLGQSSDYPAQSLNLSFAWAIPGLSESSPTYYQCCARVCSIFCTCTLACVCWLENGASWDIREVDEINLPIQKESWKHGIVIIKQGDDRLLIETSLLHLS